MNTKIKHSVKEVMKEITESKILKIVIYSFGVLVGAGFIFQAGVLVGFHKASFGRDWDANYSQNFGSRSGLHTIPDDLPNANGAFGKIIKVELPTMIVEDEKDKTEKVVLITADTEIHKMHTDAQPTDLTPDTFVVVIGTPDAQGQIEAKLIRILPAPPTDGTAPAVPPTPPPASTN